MRIRFFALAALALSLAACTQDELAGDKRLPEGEYPVVIRATGLSVEATPLAAPSTRAAVDGDWQGVTSVALKMGDAVKEYTVTASTDFKSATLTSNDPYYWISRNPITVSAWWPLDDTDITQMPAVKVAEDQSKLADFQNSDFISAENRKVEFNNPTLEFTHRTARVTIELKPGTGFTSVAGATVSLVGLSADNGNPTAIKTYNASGNTYEALTAPQTVAAGKPFVKVELGGGTFYFRPQNNVVLEAGNRYKYTVKVNATGLTLEGCTIGEWADGGEETVESIVFKTDLSTAKVGDFITTDGKLLEMTESMTLSEEVKKRIAGVVFWVPEKKDPNRQTQASLQSDEVMAKAHPNCTHGLAVSLKDVSAEMKWQGGQYEAVLNFQRGDAFNPAYDKSLFKPIASNNGSSHPINFILGYQNTLILRAYNVYCKSIGSGNKVVLPVDALAGFETNNPSPSNSTGWFLPSPKELHILCYKDVDNIGRYWEDPSYTDTRDIVNKSLIAADGGTFAYNYYYWSSSEFGGFLSHAFLVNFRNSNVISVSKYYNTYRVRAVCAF
ncbi:MAG: fimbrillin family protein [Bacteroidales bacterium]|nr:fimbrillin family protein [Bacteroidales bacterium]